MLSLDEFRRLIDRPDLTDEQIAQARDLLATLADMLVADYLASRDTDVPKRL